MIADASSNALESSSQTSLSAVKGTNQPSPNRPSLAQSVRAVPMETVQQQMLDHYMGEVLTNRENTVDILMENLYFIGKNGQPLHMMPKLELDPALLEQPLYH